MSTITTPTRYTPQDLLTMPDGERYELVDGNLVERIMSTPAEESLSRLRIEPEKKGRRKTGLTGIFDGELGWNDSAEGPSFNMRAE